MTAIAQALARLRANDPLARAGIGATDGVVHDELRRSGVNFAAVGSDLEARWHQALSELRDCIHPLPGSPPVLHEGGVYRGAWIESTGSINVELLSRFVPTVTHDTHLLFATHQRADGLIPYKVTDAGPAYLQIQIVSPLARGVWHHYLGNGRDRTYLRTMFDALTRYDTWLTAHRDTRGTGGTEAFCTFDTGHDLSPRFWHVADRCYQGDAARFDPDNPRLPFVAPDLTAHTACQREYLARIAEELGEDGGPWRTMAEASRAALVEQCFDEADQFFYDRDATGELVRIQSDVLLRVLACEIGDGAFFAGALERYLLNPRKFLGHYGFTSLSLDDPRFDHDYTRNSWGGPVNFLSLIRAPNAFEHHGHAAELGQVSLRVLAAMARADRFPQCLDPWSGEPGFTTGYSPSILWLLDTLERYVGILPRPDGTLWLSGLAPTRLGLDVAVTATAYSRTVPAGHLELAADDSRVEVYRDGARYLAFPRGWRVTTDDDGVPTSVVGLSLGPVSGDLATPAGTMSLTVAGNETVALDGLAVTARSGPGVVLAR